MWWLGVRLIIGRSSRLSWPHGGGVGRNDMQHAFLAQAKNVFSHTLLQSPQLDPLAVSMHGLSLRFYFSERPWKLAFSWIAICLYLSTSTLSFQSFVLAPDRKYTACTL
jgi:hypothetical protein